VIVQQLLRPLPPVPSLTPIYKATQTTTTDETATTFTFSDIGTQHPKRVLVIGYMAGVGAVASTVTCNGMTPVGWEDNTNGTRYSDMYVFKVPTGDTAAITASTVGSLRKAVHLWVFYPNKPHPVSVQQANAAANVAMVASALTVQAGGALFYVAASVTSSSITWTTTWAGTESVVEDADAILESGSSYSAGHINILASSTSDLTMTGTLTTAKQGSALVLGPAYG
jgi:hypothetical protein